MVKLTSLASLLLLAVPAVWATPTPELTERNNNNCVSTPVAKQLIKDFVSLFEKLDEKVAKRILTPDFTVYSASINFLIGKMVRRLSPASRRLETPFRDLLTLVARGVPPARAATSSSRAARRTRATARRAFSRRSPSWTRTIAATR